MKRLKTAIIGTGFMGKVHAENVRRLGHVEIAAVAASSDEKAHQFGQSIGVDRTTGDYHTLLKDPEIAAVHVLTPNALHHGMCKAALGAGKHVLCEKPFTMTSAEARELVDLAASAKLANCIQHNLRYYPVVQQIRRMIEAGEDPLYIARRVVRMAVEDIGLADPNALSLCMAARDAVDFIGMPEGNLALAQAVVYLSVAPKSNALYTAYGNVQQDIERTAAEPVPLHLRNAPTGLMKGLGYGKDYQYAHDVEGKVANMQCLPGNLSDRVYYRPTNEGMEKRIRERMEEIKKLRARDLRTDST